MTFQRLTYSIPWNLFLITLGSIIFSIGLKAIVIPHGMITGGFSGAGILIYYYTNLLTPGTWYMIINIPVFILGWKFISRRFFLYSLYGAVMLTIFIDLINFTIAVNDNILAVLAGGTIMGAGAGITFRSLGSAGGNDIISVMLNQKFGIRIGTYTFLFNLVLFVFSFGSLNTDLVLYSMAMSFITSQVVDYFMMMFNQRKMIIVISEKSKTIADEVIHKMKRGVTFLKGEGAYTGKEKNVLLTVVNTFQIKRIEEIAYQIDPDAFLIVENTFNVLGKGFSKRKIY
ncbi:MAG: YitT family protein [Desulfobacteraceae bacterium]|nr:YitT family protein [Desulfobacteraceae bacterium]